MRARVLWGSLVGALGLVLVAGPAFADDPVDIGGAQISDRAGVLQGDDTARVGDAIQRLDSERGVPLFVVYVDDFDGAASDQDWANQTAVDSGLLDTEVLLAISVDGASARWSVAEGFALSDDRLAQILNDDVLPAVRDDRFGDAGVAAADGMNGALAPSPVPWIIGGVVVAGIGTAVTVSGVRRRRARREVEGAAKADADELERRAGSLLVELDDSLKTSEQELGFAQAQFGEDQTRDFSDALATAKATAKQAFEIRQKLDDAYPETPEEHRSMTLQLIALAEEADATLDAQAQAFDDLRKLDRDAPQVLETVAAEQSGLAARIDAAEARISELRAQYPKADLSTITGVPAQARKLTAFAATAVEKAHAELAKPKGEAAVAVRGAQQAVGQVGQLLASVETLGSHLAEAEAQATQAAAALQTETGAAQSAISATQDYITTNRGAVGTTARTRISEAARHLEAAAGLATGQPEQAIAEVRDAQRLASIALSQARSDVDAYGNRPTIQDWDNIPARDEADGASLGGILSDLFFGGGSSGSSGSSSGGGWSWGGGGGSSWSSSRPSGFGGSSRRSSSSFSRPSSSSRRSSGGRSSGGGHRR